MSTVAYTDIGGATYVSTRGVCRNLGIASNSQCEKIKGDSKWLWSAIISHDSLGKRAELLCLRADQVAAWLFGINSARIKPECRTKLLIYQADLMPVIDRHVRGNKNGNR